MLKVLCDPGHSGDIEPGAIVDGVRETDIVWSIACRVEKTLSALHHEAWYSRVWQPPQKVTFRQRNTIAKLHQCNMVVSIHADSNGSSDVHGVRTYYWPTSPQGRYAAHSIIDHWPDELRSTSSTAIAAISEQEWVAKYGEARRDAYWLQRARNVVGAYTATAVLVECGFLSNDNDRKLLQNSLIQDRCALAIVQGLIAASA